MSNTAAVLASAWQNRWEEASAAFRRAEAAPGLFRPEYVATLHEEALRAQKQYQFWLRHGGRR